MGREGSFDRPIARFARSRCGSPKAFVFLYLMCYCNLSIFELIFDAERVHLLPANGNISFIVMLFPVFKLMLLRELKGNPVHLVSGIEQTERPQHC